MQSNAYENHDQNDQQLKRKPKKHFDSIISDPTSTENEYNDNAYVDKKVCGKPPRDPSLSSNIS